MNTDQIATLVTSQPAWIALGLLVLSVLVVGWIVLIQEEIELRRTTRCVGDERPRKSA